MLYFWNVWSKPRVRDTARHFSNVRVESSGLQFILHDSIRKPWFVKSGYRVLARGIHRALVKAHQASVIRVEDIVC